MVELARQRLEEIEIELGELRTYLQELEALNLLAINLGMGGEEFREPHIEQAREAVIDGEERVELARSALNIVVFNLGQRTREGGGRQGGGDE